MKKSNCRKIIYFTITFIILPFCINILLESLGSKQLWGGFRKLINDPYIFLCNTLIIASTLSIGALFKRFRIFWVSIVSIGWISLAAINFLVLCNRTMPFTIYDLQMVNTLPLIVKNYISPFLLAIICLFIIAIMLGIIILFFKALAKPREKRPLIAPVIYTVLTISLMFGTLTFARNNGVLETRFPDLSDSFVRNGFAYSFSVALVDNGIDRVEGYSQELIHDIVAELPHTDNKNIKKPNIIVVQMESFFDLNEVKGVSFSENPVPNFTKLAAEYPSGLLTVPVIGAGTANTEFEVVTGMRVFDFGIGEYPYKTILTDNSCESLATNLKNHGYTSHFIHNYKGSFYGRNTVYQNLGYDQFYSIEYMTGYSKTETGWPKDDILLRYINESLDSTEGTDLVTVISVQGHGGYNDVKDFEKHITVNNWKNESSLSAYEYYVNQIYEMDAFIGELVEVISARDEETILVIYGDHLPDLGLSTKDFTGRNTYQTDYLIWNNMGLEYSEENLHAYQIGSKILESIGISDGVINACHQRYKEDEQYLYYLRTLEYDMLYGKGYIFDKVQPFASSEMLINCRKFKIGSVSPADDSLNEYIVKGEGFTDRSFVKIEYRLIPTEYIDENTLKFKYTSPLSNKKLSIWENEVGESDDFFIEELD